MTEHEYVAKRQERKTNKHANKDSEANKQADKWTAKETFNVEKYAPNFVISLKISTYVRC